MDARSLLEYGIAVNFFGNYARESKVITGANDLLISSLSKLQGLILGGSIVYGFQRFASSIIDQAKSMEQNFANLTATLGTTAKALETLEWARIKGAETPFEIEEVNQAVGLMTTLGFNKNTEMRDKVFNAVGDFSALKGWDFSDMMSRVAKASFGNWESLGDQWGIRKQTIGNMAMEQVNRTPFKYSDEEKKEIKDAINIMAKGKQGTDEFRMAIVTLMGAIGKGGMNERVKTIAGAVANLDDVVANFMMQMVGYSQIEGTFANAIRTTLVENVLNPFMEAHTMIDNGQKKSVTAVDQLGTIGQRVGQVLIQVWSAVDSVVGKASSTLVDYIDDIYLFFNDYKKNVAPIILFIALATMMVEDFFRGFIDGFKVAFGGFYTAGKLVWETLGTIIQWMGFTGSNAKSLGILIGALVGSFVGLKTFKFMMYPLAPLNKWLLTSIGYLDTLILKGRLAKATMHLLSGNLSATWLYLRGAVGAGQTNLAKAFTTMTTSIISATTASWAFVASLLANPITWVVAGIVALVASLIAVVYYWDEICKYANNFSDAVLAGITLFNPMIGFLMIVAKHWDTIKDIAVSAWNIIGLTSKIVWYGLRDKVLIPMKNLIIGTWNSAKKVGLAFINAMVTRMPFLAKAITPFKKLVEVIGGIFTKIYDFVGKIIDKFTSTNFIGDFLKKISLGLKETEKDLESKVDAKKNSTKVSDNVAKVEEHKSLARLGGDTNVTQEADKKINFNNPIFNITPKGDGRSFFDDLVNVASTKGYAV